MLLYDLMEEFSKLAPPEFAMSWDNSGLLLGHPDADIRRIYISLDASGEAVEEAARMDCDLILTHHPLIFTPVGSVTSDDFIGRRLLTAAENRIAIFAMHTNFDIAVMGSLAARIAGQHYEQPLETVLEIEGKPLGIGSVGGWEAEFTLGQLAKHIKESFDLPQIRCFGDPLHPVSKAAICPGSGKGMAKEALAAGCDVLITGDIDHHEGIDSLEKGLCILDAGHHGLEHVFVDYMEKFLKDRYPFLTVIKDTNRSPFSVI